MINFCFLIGNHTLIYTLSDDIIRMFKNDCISNLKKSEQGIFCRTHKTCSFYDINTCLMILYLLYSI